MDTDSLDLDCQHVLWQESLKYTNILKSEEITQFYLIFFADLNASVIETAMFCSDFLYFL